MKAAILYGGHDFRIEELSDPVVGNNDCLVRVYACGVCHSEIHQWENTDENLEYPRFIGHEVAGIIEQVGAGVTKFNIGDRVALWTDGKGFAEKVAIDEKYIFKLSDSVTFEEALAEPIGCTTNGAIKSNIKLDDTVAIIGVGFMGLILLQQIKLQGAGKIIAIDIRDDMLDLAKYYGATEIINPLNVDLNARIQQITEGTGVDVAFEVGGNNQTINTAASITRMEGKIVIFGFHPGQRVINDFGFWNWMAFDIINAHFRNIDTILEGTRIGVQLLNSKKIDMSKLVTHKYSIEEIEEAFQSASKKEEGFIKAVIVFDEK